MHTLLLQNHEVVVCTQCGSDDVCRDAATRWDVEEQRWVITTIYDGGTCNKCNEEDSLEKLHLNHREGWDLFDYDTMELLQIQTLDAADIFKTDEQAVAYVRAQAVTSPRHAEAIAAHDADAPAIAAIERNLRGSI